MSSVLVSFTAKTILLVSSLVEQSGYSPLAASVPSSLSGLEDKEMEVGTALPGITGQPLTASARPTLRVPMSSRVELLADSFFHFRCYKYE